MWRRFQFRMHIHKCGGDRGAGCARHGDWVPVLGAGAGAVSWRAGAGRWCWLCAWRTQGAGAARLLGLDWAPVPGAGADAGCARSGDTPHCTAVVFLM